MAATETKQEYRVGLKSVLQNMIFRGQFFENEFAPRGELWAFGVNDLLSVHLKFSNNKGSKKFKLLKVDKCVCRFRSRSKNVIGLKKISQIFALYPPLVKGIWNYFGPFHTSWIRPILFNSELKNVHIAIFGGFVKQRRSKWKSIANSSFTSTTSALTRQSRAKLRRYC
jgi:hypothetical protein